MSEEKFEPTEELVNQTPEAVEETAENVQEAVQESVQEEAPAAPRASAHMTASAAAINAANEEVDIRRRNGRQEQKPHKVSKISYERKKKLYGYGFIALWIVGVIYMFIIPLVQSLWYSLCYTELVSEPGKLADYGMSKPGMYAEWNDFGNYHDAFFNDQNFLPNLTKSLGETAYKVPLILVFSLFVALLLVQKFRGRTLARAIFFLPVLIATGPVLSVINGDMLSQGISSADQFSTLFKVDLMDSFLSFLGLNVISEELTTMLQDLTGMILNLIWNSGIQILIFLAALQQIPTASKEAAMMEGATGWEFFWKITFPTISPMILANLIYTVIDAFVASDNPVMQQVVDQTRAWNHGFSSALAWIYFVIVGVALGIIVAIASKFVFYQVD